MTDAADSFNQIAAALDYPMVVATARSEEGPAGCLVGFWTQCSIEPLRFLVCLSDRNRTARVAADAEVLAVHFPAADDLQLAELFGTETGDDTDKFSRWGWSPGPAGAPILAGCANWFAARILDRHPLGDHIGYLLEPIEAHSDGSDQLLRFQQVNGLDAGHAADEPR